MAKHRWGFWIVFALVIPFGLSCPSAAQTTAIRKALFYYDADSGLLTREVVEPDQTSLRQQTDYVYDAFGNRVVTTISGAGITPRSSTTSYDTRGQFATGAANALGHSESWQYDARTGLPLSHTGPNGLTTTWSYDGFGRKVLEVRFDGTRTTWIYQYCNGTGDGTASCPTGAAYLVRTTLLAANGSTQIGPVATTYFDQLERVIASDTQGFDGSLTRQATQYDALGRVAKVSQPYFVSGGTPRWTTSTYDVLDRPLVQTAPDSGTTTRVYQGLTSSVTNALGQTQTLVRNSLGQSVSVKDAGNQTTTYAYDPFGNVTQVRDQAGNSSRFSYDQRGRKIADTDPDMGLWTFTYDALGQLKTQTDAKGQVTSYTFDLLGRLTQHVSPDLVSTWTYDTASKGVGKLATASTNSGYQRAHSYDALGRPSQALVTIDGVAHTFTTGYDGASRVNAVGYPSGLAIAYAYNIYGYQTQLSNSASGQVYWTANAWDASGQLKEQTAGNGIATWRSFDPYTERLTKIETGTSGSVQNFNYSYDMLGQLLTRSDANSAMAESFTYDALNRLVQSTVNLSPSPLVKTFLYSVTGNLLSKSDVGTYYYPTPGSPRSHAVTSISGSNLNTTFTYDANGNQTSGAGRTISFTSYNAAESITRGTTTLNFKHDPDYQRYEQTGPGGTTLYLSDMGGSGVRAERFLGTGGTVQWSNYLRAGGELIGVVIERTDEPTLTRYFHADHLGSITAITDENGAVAERIAYDSWGKRRLIDGSDDPAGSLTSQVTRGYTGHEMLADVALVHMNGRIYDPYVGRFTSADIFVANSTDSQSWNRYSYVRNTPLNGIDPTGWFNNCLPNQNCTIELPALEVTASAAPNATSNPRRGRNNGSVGFYGVPGAGGPGAGNVLGSPGSSWSAPFAYSGASFAGSTPGSLAGGANLSNRLAYCIPCAPPLGQLAVDAFAVALGLGLFGSPDDELQKPLTLFHYTTERSMRLIVETGYLNPSLKANNPNDVRYGDGQYLTDIPPGTKTPAQLSRLFIDNPFQGRRFTHYVAINVDGLPVVLGRPHVYVLPNVMPLFVGDRLVGYGAN